MLVGRFAKETSDTSRFTIDATQWLDAGEAVVSYTAPLVTQVVSSFPGAVNFAYQPLYLDLVVEGVAPPDPYPIVLVEQFNLVTTLRFLVAAGTPGQTYQFQISILGTSGRVVTVEVFINIIGAPGVPYPVVGA